MKVVILAGGLGTRLGELTRDVPKPMIEIAGRPYLEFVVQSFAKRGLRDFVMLIGHRADVIENHFGDGTHFGIRVAYSRERELLGTGGAIREARHLIGDRFVLTFGDVYREFDYDRFVREHSEPCTAVYPKRTAGNMEIDGNLVLRYDKRAPELPWIDAGFSHMPAETIDMLPPSGACSFEEIVFTRLIAERRLTCERVDQNFCDIGTPEELERTRAMLERS
jgi:NDP-sugar pyrophosphorylase family protein